MVSAQGYRQELVSVKDLEAALNTLNIKEKALRSRAKEHVLVYVTLHENGRTRLYDKFLSIIRVKVAYQIKQKNPGLLWDRIGRTFTSLDKSDGNPDGPLNDMISRFLDGGSNEDAVVKRVADIVFEKLGHEW